MHITHRLVALSVAVLCLSGISSYSQTAPTASTNSQLIAIMTTETFQQRVQALGFSPERGSTDGKLDDYFTFRAEGRKVAGRAASPEVLELFVYYTDGATFETVNEWNNTHIGSTAFVDKGGSAVLESDLVLTGGVSRENLDAFITNFRDAATDYARFVIDHKKKS